MRNSENSYILVIGAANIDIGGTSYSPLIPEDSNPGKIIISSGGVGRNIAHNLIRLGMKVRLMTAVGSDPLGKDLLMYCNNIGMDTGCSLIADDCISSMYLFISDCDGDMRLALSDMEVCSRISPEYIDRYTDVINGAAAVAADCNLSEETLLHLKDICKPPLFIDTVSAAKSSKIKSSLEGVFAVKPNRIEAEVLSGIKINNIEDCIRAAKIIIDKGAANVFISMGEEGMIAADNTGKVHIVCRYDTEVVNTTGAGDASTAAIIWSFISGAFEDNDDLLLMAAKAANATASITIESPEAINHEMTAGDIISRIRNHS